MLNRRKFLALSAAAWPAMALGAGKHIPLGVQLYTIRSLVKDNNLPALLKQIRAIGYEEVELYSDLYTKRTASELSTTLRRARLSAVSGHFNYDDFVSKIPYARRLGVKWMVCPILPKAQWGSPEGFRRAAAAFNQWGKQCQQHGMRFAFHNHNYEFQDLKGTTGFDILVKETDPDLVWLELDTYWIAQAGRDPVLLLNQLGRRVRLLHLKDRQAGFPTSQVLDDSAAHFSEVGNGTIAWRPLLALAQKLGIEHYFVEQDKSDKSPMDSLKISYSFLRKILN
ncbi:MAG TPA: sugar phosphate isomerase/epimerase [Acidobacteriaceae bacterium]|jgi:sugar phosphate isomerase/epimerase|nr:sugar phosphate isomerase/epimerase [Acidobacteriaceae bacterium]